MNISVNRAILEKVCAKIALQTGLDFSSRNLETLESKLIRVTQLLAYENTEAFISDYLNNRLSPRQVEELIETITIGETYFFRDDQVFDLLEKVILPSIVLKKQNSDKHIRIWSSGCANGEEPYSIAILVHKMHFLLSEFDVSILATDINVKALNKAMDGVFSEWSFRNMPDWIRKKYFTPTSDNQYALMPEVMKMVRFEYLNLAEDKYPSLLNATNAMDIIICKNVLMYLTEDIVSSVLKRYSHCLLDEGILIVSACELSDRMLSEFIPRIYPGCILYQKLSTNLDDSSPHLILREVVAETIKAVAFPKDQTSVPEDQYSKIERHALAQINESPQDAIAIELLCRIVANQGRLTEALAWSEKLLNLDKLNPSYHYLRAIILFELNQFEEASSALRNTLFLDENRAIAYFMLGNIARQLGTNEDAINHFKNALDILNHYSPEMVVQDTDGLQVIKLREFIQGAINSL